MNDNSSSKPGSSSGATMPKAGSPIDPRFSATARYAKRNKQKRIALIVAAAGLVGVSTLSILAFLGRASGQFTIKINPQVTSGGLRLSEKRYGETSSVLLAPGLDSAHLDTASEVLPYIDSLEINDDYGGAYNRIDATGENQTALVYTFYATNLSSSDSIDYMVSFNMNDYVAPSNGAMQPYTYIRVALYENDAADTSTNDFTVYGLKSTTNRGTAEAQDDYRECLSTFGPREGLGIRTPSYTYDGNHGYCEEFKSNYEIFNKKTTIDPASCIRYTIAVWAEGWDYDCKGDTPEGVSFTFSMDFNAI